MTILESLHRRAMEAADLAESERRMSRDERARKLFWEALRLETEAARLVAKGLEPTRSILFRSAASLALDCGFYSQARDLVEEARTGNPPAEIADELAEIEVQIQRHLVEAKVRDAS